jgi:TRAP-type uncharacterized transport system fused permease subunit
MTVKLILYSLFPLVLLMTFDEISTTYKSPFIMLCTLILTAGIVGYQRNRSARWRWLILLSAAVLLPDIFAKFLITPRFAEDSAETHRGF